MVLFNYSTKELTAKVVYYGPGLCGKTTNLQWIHEKLPIKNKGKMLSLATETDRTLFFDFLPIELGTIRGMKTRVQLYTVPGQVFYNATRRMVLKGADGVVFVADSQDAMLDANAESLENLRENLEVNEISLQDVPLVLQYNKRDLPNAASIADLNAKLNPHGLPYYEAVAVNGVGVEETLKGVTSVVFKSLAARYGGAAGAAAAAKTSVPAPNIVTTQPVAPQAPPPRPPPTSAPEADMFSPEDLLEVVEDEASADALPELALESERELIEELTMDELGAEPLLNALGPAVVDVDSAGPLMDTIETVEDFSPLAELEDILEGDDPSALAFEGAPAELVDDPFAEFSSDGLEIAPEEFLMDESTATAPAEPLPPVAAADPADAFSPGSLLLGDEPEAPSPPDAGPEAAPELAPLFGLGASALPEFAPPFIPGGTAAAEFELSVDGLDGAPEAPELVERDAFSPGSLLGDAPEPAPDETTSETEPESAFDLVPPQLDVSAEEFSSESAFELDALAPALELDGSTAPSSEPALDLDLDELTADAPAAESPEFDPLGLAAESQPEPEPELEFEFEPQPRPRPVFGSPAETASDEPFSGVAPETPWGSGPASPLAPEVDPLAGLSPRHGTLPVAASPLELEAASVATAPASEPPAPAAPSVMVPEPVGVPAVGMAVEASTQPVSPRTTGALLAAPSARVSEASLAVAGRGGDNEITIPVEVSLGPGGATSLNLNIRLVLNFKMK